MAKIMIREALLILLLGLLSGLFLPWVVGDATGGVWYLIGILMGLTYAPMYALAVLGGKKMPANVRRWLGVLAWVGLFFQDYYFTGMLLSHHVSIGAAEYYRWLAPGLFGLLLPLLAALQVGPGKRVAAALDTSYAYSFPMLLVLWVLIPLMGQAQTLRNIGSQAAALFMAMHVLMRLYSPNPVEGTQTRPLIYRHPVPDAIVALVERTARHRARPFVTMPDGSEDDGAISLLCPQAEAAAVVDKLAEALAGKPFAVSTGQKVNHQVEVCVRPDR
ncbi:MAG: hypothetical protein ACM3XM_15590 [Mycobacterium leprae]